MQESPGNPAPLGRNPPAEMHCALRGLAGSAGPPSTGSGASASIRHHSSSQLPPEREAQRWTASDRGNQPSHEYLVNYAQMACQESSHPNFPEVIDLITEEGPRGIA